MRVYTHSITDPGDGGPSKAVVEICHALQDASLEVEKRPLALAGAGEHSHTSISPAGKLDYKYSPKLAQWLDANVKKYDVLHIHAVFNYSTHAACRAARRRASLI